TGYIGKDRNIGDLIAQTPSSFDYLIVQYYNNIECTYPFGFNYESWKNLFSGKIYVGLPGDWISAISGGFLEAANLQAVYDYVKNDGQFAGISLYDQPAGVALFADGIHDAARDDDRDGGGGTGGGTGGNRLCIPVRRHVGVCERDVRGGYVQSVQQHDGMRKQRAMLPSQSQSTSTSAMSATDAMDTVPVPSPHHAAATSPTPSASRMRLRLLPGASRASAHRAAATADTRDSPASPMLSHLRLTTTSTSSSSSSSNSNSTSISPDSQAPAAERAVQFVDPRPPLAAASPPAFAFVSEASPSPSPSMQRDHMRMSPSLSLNSPLLFAFRSSSAAGTSSSNNSSRSNSPSVRPASAAFMMRRKLSWNLSSTLSRNSDSDRTTMKRASSSSSVLGSFLSAFGFRAKDQRQQSSSLEPQQVDALPTLSATIDAGTYSVPSTDALSSSPSAAVPVVVSDGIEAPLSARLQTSEVSGPEILSPPSEPELDSGQFKVLSDANGVVGTPENMHTVVDTAEETKNKLCHKIIWAVSSELDPTDSSLITAEFVRMPIHAEIEDIHWPSKEDKTMWTLNGLGGDHVLHGHSFNNGGVVTSEWDKAFQNEQSADKVDVTTDAETVSSGSSSELNDATPQQDLMEFSVDSRKKPEAVNSSYSSAASFVSSDTESTLSSTQSINEDKVNLASSSQASRQAYQSKVKPEKTVAVSSAKEKRLPTTESSRLFILADGHGGILASKFFVPRAKAALAELIQSRTWDFSRQDDREEFESKVVESFRTIDAEYCAIQVDRYRTWIDEGSIASERPEDDGCALAVAVIHNSWLVNLNVGDSRMALMSRAKNSSSATWKTVFVSTDHNMTHPAKVYSIFKAGGHFMSPSHTLIHIVPDDPTERHTPYTELASARIYRHPSAAVKAVGVSHRRTLNLTGTMGDLLFKIEPPVLNGIPDVSFVELDASQWDYVMILATDGIWDHLMDNSSESERQADIVAKIVAAAVESVEDDARENAADWDTYWREKDEWTALEKERRARRREERKRRKQAASAGATGPAADADPAAAADSGDLAHASSSSSKIPIGMHGSLGDVAVAAEPSEKCVGGDDDDSVASSNGSTAVASKSKNHRRRRRRVKSAAAPTSLAVVADNDGDDEDDDNDDDDALAMDADAEDESAGSSEQVGCSRKGGVGEEDDSSELVAAGSKTPPAAVQHADAADGAFSSAEFPDVGDFAAALESIGFALALPPPPPPPPKPPLSHPPQKPKTFDFHAVLEARLQQVADVLAEREMGDNYSSYEEMAQRIHPAILEAAGRLYWPKQIRYDDATAFVAYFG
ncbi:hypothetical protein HDU84_007960, partial [Entophlyctis sp. JEL0112]